MSLAKGGRGGTCPFADDAVGPTEVLNGLIAQYFQQGPQGQLRVDTSEEEASIIRCQLFLVAPLFVVEGKPLLLPLDELWSRLKDDEKELVQGALHLMIVV